MRKKETLDLLKKKISRKYIYLVYIGILILVLIVTSSHLIQTSSDFAQNHCTSQSGTWDKQKNICK